MLGALTGKHITFSSSRSGPEQASYERVLGFSPYPVSVRQNRAPIKPPNQIVCSLKAIG